MIDVLSRQITGAVGSDKLEGIIIKKRCPHLHHLLFVDDSLFLSMLLLITYFCLKKLWIYFVVHWSKEFTLQSLTYFSQKNARKVTRQLIHISIREVEDLGKYLGLPTIWGRSKKETLTYLKSWIQNKMQGWKHLLLNVTTGREVLIKSVVIVIPHWNNDDCKLLVGRKRMRKENMEVGR